MSFPLPLYHREDDLFRTKVALQRTQSQSQNSSLRSDKSQQDRGYNTPTPPIAESTTKSHTTYANTSSSSPLATQSRRLVLPDPIAFRYLEEDPCVHVVERREKLPGYELYLVEQWACSRQSPTLVIVTYTGDEKQSVAVGVLSVPADEDAWSPRLRAYFKAIQQYHARPRETPLGEVMVTNLSSFPSALTVIPVPDGDIKAHRREFVVNEDLKRLGCSGRSGLTLSEPTGAAKAKFYQLYRTSEKIPFSDSVVELIKLCQVALYLFGKLGAVYIDGLLCDVTETAVADWWTEFGAEYYNVEPADGILGPTTVVALLGLLMGARNRLSYLGAPVSKDVFDIDATERGIYYFQKYLKIERSQRTRRLDRQTLYKLHAATAKAAAGEGWGVQKAVKSTVREIGGERGELVLGMVGSRDKGAIGDIETLDLGKFIKLLSGERTKWLWLGKPKRSTGDTNEKAIPDVHNILFHKEELASQSKRAHPSSQDDDSESRTREDSPAVYGTPAPGSAVSIGAAVDTPTDKDAQRRGVFKSVARDARSGFGRIKDAVYNGGTPKSQSIRQSKEYSSIDTPFQGSAASASTDTPGGSQSSAPPAPVARAFTWKTKPEEYLSAMRRERGLEPISAASGGPGRNDILRRDSPPTNRSSANKYKESSEDVTDLRNDLTTIASSVAGSATADEQDLRRPTVMTMPQHHFSNNISNLHRRHSGCGFEQPQVYLNESRWPRRLSFSEAEEAVFRWEELVDLDEAASTIPAAEARDLASLAEMASSLYRSILDITQGMEPWVEDKIEAIEALDVGYAQQQEELQEVLERRREAHGRARQDARELAAAEREGLTELLRDVEGWGQKLEYEVAGLESRVQDFEAGVDEFEARVADVERRARELKAHLETESWVHWAVRTLTGIGTGPNITREQPGEAAEPLTAAAGGGGAVAAAAELKQ